MISEMAQKLDGFINSLTGLGSLARDKVLSASFQRSPEIPDTTLDALYRGDDMASRIIEALPLDAWRQGYTLNIEADANPESIQLADDMVEYAEDLGFRRASLEAMYWARLFGAGAVYVIANDGRDQSQEINLESIQEIVGLHVFDRRDLRVVSRYTDPMHKSFGKPEVFAVVQRDSRSFDSSVMIHETRLVKFFGVPRLRSDRTGLNDDDWGGYSVLERVMTPLRDFQVFWQAMSHLMQDSAQGVFKIDGLIDMIASNNKDLLAARMQVVDMGRSVARALMLDAKMESFERQAHNMNGLDEVADRFSLRLAAAARMPVTLLMGQSPAGLNATGESDMRNWHDQVRQYQESDLRPAIEQFLTIAMHSGDSPSAGTPPDDWSIFFNPLLQSTESEVAELRKRVAETDSIYVNMGVLLPEEVALNRFSAGGWSMETAIDLTAREEMLNLEMERELELAANPPELPPPPDADAMEASDIENEGDVDSGEEEDDES